MFKQKLKNVKLSSNKEKIFQNKKFRKIIINRNKLIKRPISELFEKSFVSSIFYYFSKIALIIALLYTFIKLKIFKKSGKIFFCFCGMARHENIYTRELISYYLSIGTGKFIFGDNNDLDSEKISDVTQDYIKNGIVDIIDLRGQKIDQTDFYKDAYELYKNKCKWISFFDFDEYLVMHFDEKKNISVQEFLSNKIYLFQHILIL